MILKIKRHYITKMWWCNKSVKLDYHGYNSETKKFNIQGIEYDYLVLRPNGRGLYVNKSDIQPIEKCIGKEYILNENSRIYLLNSEYVLFSTLISLNTVGLLEPLAKLKEQHSAEQELTKTTQTPNEHQS